MYFMWLFVLALFLDVPDVLILLLVHAGHRGRRRQLVGGPILRFALLSCAIVCAATVAVAIRYGGPQSDPWHAANASANGSDEKVKNVRIAQGYTVVWVEVGTNSISFHSLCNIRLVLACKVAVLTAVCTNAGSAGR
jgi:hypothetical protein